LQASVIARPLLPQPKAWRIILGFVLSPLIPAVFLVAPTFPALGLVMLYVYPPTILLGVPTYFLLRHRVRPRIWILMLAGGIIAAAPWAAYLLYVEGPTNGSIGTLFSDCQNVIDHKTTWCGLNSTLEFFAMLFELGAAGGLIFWLCLVWRGFSKERSLPSQSKS
jgi:hypothetical protein